MAAGKSTHPSWVQLGGLERRYEALDIGPAAVLELTLLPRLWQDLPTVFDKSAVRGGARTDMVLDGACFGWNPTKMLGIVKESEVSNKNTIRLYDKDEVDIFAFVFLPLDKVIFLPNENLGKTYQKKLEFVKGFNAVESLKTAIEIINILRERENDTESKPAIRAVSS